MSAGRLRVNLIDNWSAAANRAMESAAKLTDRREAMTEYANGQQVECNFGGEWISARVIGCDRLIPALTICRRRSGGSWDGSLMYLPFLPDQIRLPKRTDEAIIADAAERMRESVSACASHERYFATILRSVIEEVRR